MPPIINFKICDNSADCNGIVECPTGVFGWDDVVKTITIDKEKCIECGACANFCSVEAIRYAKDEEELAKIQKEIDDDPRTVADLFIERYGCAPITDTHSFKADPETVRKRSTSGRPVIVEFNAEETIECLLRSVPIADIQAEFHKDAIYSKFIVDKSDFALFGITKTPCLRFYNKGELLGSIDGFFDKDEKYEQFEKIAEFGRKVG